ncbi:MAG: hypothetical protein QME16_00230 [Planctomycetota bacterium]|nr:hypothetical protein [Planctomycetota bacterium]
MHRCVDCYNLKTKRMDSDEVTERFGDIGPIWEKKQKNGKAQIIWCVYGRTNHLYYIEPRRPNRIQVEKCEKFISFFPDTALILPGISQ